MPDLQGQDNLPQSDQKCWLGGVSATRATDSRPLSRGLEPTKDRTTIDLCDDSLGVEGATELPEILEEIEIEQLAVDGICGVY